MEKFFSLLCRHCRVCSVGFFLGDSSALACIQSCELVVFSSGEFSRRWWCFFKDFASSFPLFHLHASPAPPHRFFLVVHLTRFFPICYRHPFTLSTVCIRETSLIVKSVSVFGCCLSKKFSFPPSLALLFTCYLRRKMLYNRHPTIRQIYWTNFVSNCPIFYSFSFPLPT